MSQIPSRTYARGISVALVLAVLCAGAYFLIYKGPVEVGGATKDGVFDSLNKGYDLAKRIGSDIREALQIQPKVIVGERTILERTSEKTELVTISQVLEHSYSFEHTWAGSTKRLEMKGVFIAKAGFTVDDSFSIHVSEDGGRTAIRHGPPRLISCELQEASIVKDENGFWNKLSTEDRQSAQNSLIQGARKAAEESNLLQKAKESLMLRLAPLQAKHGFQLQDAPLP